LTVAGSGFVSGATVFWNGHSRPTTFVRSTQLTAAISASDIASGGTAQITVFNPAPGGGVSVNTASFLIIQPPPAITALSPSSVMAGSAPFDLTVNGSGFLSTSVVQWNGSSRPTTFVSSTQLTAAVSASDVSSPGTAQVTVVNPVQGNASSALAFTISPLSSNPTPAVASLLPANAPAGWPGFPLTVNGSNFVASTILQWNGLNRPTTVLSSTRLVGRIPLSDLASAGTAQVGAFTPSPGGGVSNALSFTVFTVPAGTVGVIDRSSIATDLTEADKNSRSPAVSADGRYVAFASDATNLVPSDTNGFTDVFVRDTCVGAPAGCTPSTVRVSVDSNGAQANGFSFSPAISADGRYVAFASDATNLVPSDTNGFTDIFVRDTCVGAPVGCTPSTTRVSVDSQGNQSRLPSVSPATSANGRYVAFVLGFFDYYYSFGSADVFVRDTCAGAPAGCTPSTATVSVDTNGQLSSKSDGPAAISADGRFIAFASDAPNLVANDTKGLRDVFVRDTCVGAPPSCTPSTVRVSVASNGDEANGFSDSPAMSADGRFVAFFSAASNLVAGGSGGGTNVFVRDTCRGAPAGCTPTTVLASVAPGFTGAIAGLPSISANGRWVSFSRSKDSMGGAAQAFVRDTCLGAQTGCTPTTVQVSVALDGSSGDKNSGDTTISADARFVAFSSDATNLAPGDTNSKTDILLARTGFNHVSSAASVSPSAAARHTTGQGSLKRGVAAREVSSSRGVRSSGFDGGRGRSFTSKLLDLP